MKAGPAHRLLAFLPPQGVVLEEGGRVSLTADTVIGYAGIDASRRRCGGGDAPLSLLPKAPEVDLLFDVSDVFTAVLDAPPMSEGRLRQALPGLIEERLLTDATDCELAYHAESTKLESTKRSPARLTVTAIDRVTLTRALEAAAQAQVRPRRAYSALYSIPAPAAGTLSVRVARGRGTVRTAEHSGFAFDAEPGMLAALSITVQQLGIRRIRAYGCEAAKLRRLAVPLRVDLIDTKRDFDTNAIASAVDLLQGRFAPAGRFGMPAVAAWTRSRYAKPLLVWGAVGLVIWVVGLNAYRFKLEAESRAQRAAMQTAFRSAFPSEAVVEPVAQAQRHLRELRTRAGKFSPDDFSVLNAQAAQLLSNAPIGALAGIDYRDAALTLKFKPGTADSAAFRDALRAQAPPRGLRVQFNADASARIVPATP